MLSSSISSSITHHGVILCLHSLFPYSCSLLLLFVVHVYTRVVIGLYNGLITGSGKLEKTWFDVTLLDQEAWRAYVHWVD